MSNLDFGWFTLLIMALFCLTLIFNNTGQNTVITAIQDNGCSKQTTIEIKPASYNEWPNNKGVM